VNALVDPQSRWPTAAVFAVTLAGIPVYYFTQSRQARSLRPPG